MSIFQTPEWARFKCQTGYEKFYEIDGVFVLQKKLPLGRTMLYSPMINQAQSSKFKSQNYNSKLKTLGKENKSIFYRAEFDILATSELVNWLTSNKFIKSFEEMQPEHTLVLNITKSDEDILAQMKQKGRYNIKIADYIVMDTHIHLLVYVEDVDTFSNFMRSSNAVIAKFVNGKLKRCGGVVRDRYKSPVITSPAYLIQTIVYIWLNHIKSGKYAAKNAKDYKYCSLFARSRGIKDKLVDSYDDFCEASNIGKITDKSEMRFCLELLDWAIKTFLKDLSEEFFDHLHTIGDEAVLKARRFIKNIRSIKQEYCFSDTGPPDLAWIFG